MFLLGTRFGDEVVDGKSVLLSADSLRAELTCGLLQDSTAPSPEATPAGKEAIAYPAVLTAGTQGVTGGLLMSEWRFPGSSLVVRSPS
jgi:hypothetical protein